MADEMNHDAHEGQQFGSEEEHKQWHDDNDASTPAEGGDEVDAGDMGADVVPPADDDADMDADTQPTKPMVDGMEDEEAA